MSFPPVHSASTSYVCDTIPAAKLADPDQQFAQSPQDTTMTFEPQAVLDDADAFKSEGYQEQSDTDSMLQQPPPRKLCVRHQRMADEGTNLKLQQSLDALPLGEREAVNAIWSNFSSSSHPRRALILQGLLTMCCFSQLSLLTEQLAHIIRIDPFTVLPREIGLKILGYLDAISLCRAAQVTKKWRALADDNVLWRGICEQHIGQKCSTCGWGLPVLEKKRTMSHRRSNSPCLPQQSGSQSYHQQPPPLTETRQPSTSSGLKRLASPCADELVPPLKRQRSDNVDLYVPSSPSNSSSSHSDDIHSASATLILPAEKTHHRPWKDVYSERMTIERNWRRGRCTTRTLTGHTDGVMCLQFSESLSHPAFPVLISGSYDRTVRVWNMETGAQLHCLKGHTRAVRALQFDEVKLITGSMDCTLKVWDWRRGKCIRTLAGHTEGVVCLNYDANVLASGSVDSTIKVWNLRTGGAFTLRGHSDWVNAVQLWDSNPGSSSSTLAPKDTSTIFEPPLPGSTSPNGTAPNLGCYQIDPGKMLFSASDDGTIKLWDLNARTCVRQFVGHMSQVQSMRLLLAGEHDEEDQQNGKVDESPAPSATANLLVPKRKKPVLVSGSLDNTIKLWDIETGKATRTYFGHIEGVWAVASDKMRLVSGSHDRTIKVWSRDSEKCIATLIEHQAAVSCVALGEDKLVSGSDDNTIKIWCFDD